VYYSQYVEPLWLHGLQPLCHIVVVRPSEPEPPVDSVHVSDCVWTISTWFCSCSCA
jgi:hypothetical protein